MAEDNKKTTYPFIFDGKTYDVKPGNVAIFTIKTNQVDISTAARQVERINKKLMKRGIFGIFIPDCFEFNGFTSFDEALKNIDRELKMEGLAELRRQVQEKKQEFEENGELTGDEGKN